MTGQSFSVVADLPPRVAQAVHAMMLAYEMRDGAGPLTTYEICEYDSTALTADHTRRALAAARRYGLADGARGLWIATSRAYEMRRALEDRVLAEGSAP